MTDLLRVRASRNFGVHIAGDELLVGDTAEHRANIKSGLYELLDQKPAAKSVKTKAPPKATDARRIKRKTTKGAK